MLIPFIDLLLCFWLACYDEGLHLRHIMIVECKFESVLLVKSKLREHFSSKALLSLRTIALVFTKLF